jgi:glyoxylase-like metal-dependent hydrolase (beta-lactamase superfamily II)/ferredoxin
MAAGIKNLDASDWYVDDRCIGCGASASVAPGLIVWDGGDARFVRQPANPLEEEAAWKAALVCPTGSIKRRSGGHPPRPFFPEEIAPNVFRCGFNARSSYGAHSYFIRRETGNLLVDSPRFTPHLEKFFDAQGGLSAILLSHRDDVADASRYAERFKAACWIHQEDRRAAPFATNLVVGDSAETILPGLMAIPLPGHSPGSAAFLLENRYLFTGDSLAWDFQTSTLTAFRQYAWSWKRQKESLANLLAFDFEYVFAGHGGSIHLPADEMKGALRSLLSRM